MHIPRMGFPLFLVLHTFLPGGQTQLVIWHDARKVAVCTTPKIASSSIRAFVHWAEMGPPVACPYVQQQGSFLIRGASQACPKGSSNDTLFWTGPSKFGALRLTNDGPIGGVNKAPRLPEDEAAHWSYLIPVRDPWHRLLSGLKDKLFIESGDDEIRFASSFVDFSCKPERDGPRCGYFQRELVQAFVKHNSRFANPFVRLAATMLPKEHGGGGGASDTHFYLQVQVCLYPFASHGNSTTHKHSFTRGVPPPTIVSVDDRKGEGLDAISAALGYHETSSSRGSLRLREATAGMSETAGVQNQAHSSCFHVPGTLLRMLYHFVLRRDYRALAEQGVSLAGYAESQRVLEHAEAQRTYLVCLDNKTVTADPTS